MINFFHKLLHPHCPDCKLDEQESMIDPVIELLKEENARLVRQNNELLHELIHGSPQPNAPVERDDEVAKKDWKPIQKNHQPWRVKQQMLENADRERARVLAESKKVDETLKPVGLADLEDEIAEVKEKLNG